MREREAQAKATKRQSADFREKEAQAMATKRQSADFREREVKTTGSDVSDAAGDDTDLWEALSAQHCPPPSSPPPTLTTSQLHTGQPYDGKKF